MNHRDELDARRRIFLQRAGLGAAAVGAFPLRGFAAGHETLPFGNGERELVTYPGKRPLMRVTTRPPHLETPFRVFSEGPITPNNAFFVRYHLANIPTRIDAGAYRLRVGGHVKQSLSLSLAELGEMSQRTVLATLECAGNGRSFLTPRVSGVPWGAGAVAHAEWSGVPLRDVLEERTVEKAAFERYQSRCRRAFLASFLASKLWHRTVASPALDWMVGTMQRPALKRAFGKLMAEM